MISYSQEGSNLTFSFLSPTQIMYNNIYKQIEKSDNKKQSVLIYPICRRDIIFPTSIAISNRRGMYYNVKSNSIV